MRTTTILIVVSVLGAGVGAWPSLGGISAKMPTFFVNSKRPMRVLNDKFLSLTVNPSDLVHCSDCEISEVTLTLAKALAPAYLRVAGPESNTYEFQSEMRMRLKKRADSDGNITVTGAQWINLNDFANKTGLSMIACLNSPIVKGQANWDLSNALELITFSNEMEYDLAWQMGYELQKVAKNHTNKEQDEQGFSKQMRDYAREMGRDVVRLRKILEAFPRYHDSLIAGPDMTTLDNRGADTEFIRNYMATANDALSVFTWHPNFTAVKDATELTKMIEQTLNKLDSDVWMKEPGVMSYHRGVVPKKPIWIGESEEKDPFANLTQSLPLVERLGLSARMGISVYMVKPHVLSMYEPTPEYWITLLHKSLVGNIVLDVRQVLGNATRVQIFAQCTQIADHPGIGVINPTVGYEKGAVTLFGSNPSTEKTRVSVRVSWKSEEIAHLYILTENSTQAEFSKILFNGQELNLSRERKLPVLTPKVRESPKYISIPGKSVFFIVYPEAKCRACASSEEFFDVSRKMKFEEEMTEELSEIEEEEGEERSAYVSFTHQEIPNLKKIVPSKTTGLGGNKRVDLKAAADPALKFVTYSEDNWLENFPKKMMAELSVKSEVDSDEVAMEERLEGFDDRVVTTAVPVPQERLYLDVVAKNRLNLLRMLNVAKKGDADMFKRGRMTRSVARMPDIVSTKNLLEDGDSEEQIEEIFIIKSVKPRMIKSKKMESTEDTLRLEQQAKMVSRGKRDITADPIASETTPMAEIKLGPVECNPTNFEDISETNLLVGTGGPTTELFPESKLSEDAPTVLGESAESTVVSRGSRGLNEKAVEEENGEEGVGSVRSSGGCEATKEEELESKGPVSPFRGKHTSAAIVKVKLDPMRISIKNKEVAKVLPKTKEIAKVVPIGKGPATVVSKEIHKSSAELEEMTRIRVNEMKDKIRAKMDELKKKFDEVHRPKREADMFDDFQAKTTALWSDLTHVVKEKIQETRQWVKENAKRSVEKEVGENRLFKRSDQQASRVSARLSDIIDKSEFKGIISREKAEEYRQKLSEHFSKITHKRDVSDVNKDKDDNINEIDSDFDQSYSNEMPKGKVILAEDSTMSISNKISSNVEYSTQVTTTTGSKLPVTDNIIVIMMSRVKSLFSFIQSLFIQNE